MKINDSAVNTLRNSFLARETPTEKSRGEYDVLRTRFSVSVRTKTLQRRERKEKKTLANDGYIGGNG